MYRYKTSIASSASTCQHRTNGNFYEAVAA
ncbi:Unannotated [Lentimonas sp. CC19]|nr:Unannotated [Lentimonas sp. CC10]CAA6697775.1 Unannotated [Lentimonas sp. CC19]CAA7072501.1 Unannotated [Lentimonas sp. CC11]